MALEWPFKILNFRELCTLNDFQCIPEHQYVVGLPNPQAKHTFFSLSLTSNLNPWKYLFL